MSHSWFAAEAGGVHNWVPKVQNVKNFQVELEYKKDTRFKKFFAVKKEKSPVSILVTPLLVTGPCSSVRRGEDTGDMSQSPMKGEKGKNSEKETKNKLKRKTTICPRVS